MRSAPKRVLIDARMVGPVGHGIALYVLQLAEGLSRLQLGYEPFYLIHSSCPKDSILRRFAHAECGIPFLAPQEQILLSREIRRHSPALYHTPSFASLWRYPCPHVQTVHDLNHLYFGNIAQKVYYRALLLPSLLRASAIIAVSEAGAIELEGWLSDCGIMRKAEVAPNAIALFPRGNDESVLHRHGLRAGEYFFTLSNPKAHKNLALLERAYRSAAAKEKLPPLVLSVPGSNGQGIVRTGSLGEQEVGALLRNARAFFFPSLYEGFGRPPVEAALTGVVPIVSSIPVHREALAGVAEAVFLNAKSEADWAEAFLSQARASSRVSERSMGWIRETWSITGLAAKMDQIYRGLL